ncbi:hypothetical protein [Brevundimonas sp.]|uniref:hypothetical protein n=1 Tax=Brevundimonas sp. TaxID=1871086 RepID=UPI002621054E|nr:hypothetical protein [Brevundimonas sp.]
MGAGTSTAEIGDASIAALATAIGGGGSTPGDVIAIQPVLDTVGYTSGDVLFNPATIANAVPAVGGRAILQSLTLYDGDDQGLAMDIFLCSGNVAFGTINTAPNISDANLIANQAQLVCSVVAGDWIDLGGIRVATPTIKPVLAEAGAATRDLYLAAITRGAPTHTAAGITALLGFVQL